MGGAICWSIEHFTINNNMFKIQTLLQSHPEINFMPIPEFLLALNIVIIIRKQNTKGLSQK